MHSLFPQKSLIVQGSAWLLGLISIANFLVAPANAQAVARAAVSLVRPSGVYQTISGEVVLPDGMYFDSGRHPTLIVTPSFANAGTNNESITSLTIRAGRATYGASINANPFTLPGEQTARAIQNATQIEDVAALIRALSGTQNALGAMD